MRANSENETKGQVNEMKVKCNVCKEEIIEGDIILMQVERISENEGSYLPVHFLCGSSGVVHREVKEGSEDEE